MSLIMGLFCVLSIQPERVALVSDPPTFEGEGKRTRSRRSRRQFLRLSI